MYLKNFTKDSKKVRNYCHLTGKYRGAVHSKFNMNYKITKDIPIVFHNLSSYESPFIIKEFANEFDRELECLEENTEKYFSFSVKVNKEIMKRDKDDGENIVNIPYKLKFTDTYRFMLASLSNHVDNLSNRLQNNKCTNCESGLDYMTAKDGILIFRCFQYKNNYKIDFDTEMIFVKAYMIQAHMIFVKEILMNLFYC